jgi:hypothetical protein
MHALCLKNIGILCGADLNKKTLVFYVEPTSLKQQNFSENPTWHFL